MTSVDNGNNNKTQNGAQSTMPSPKSAFSPAVSAPSSGEGRQDEWSTNAPEGKAGAAPSADSDYVPHHEETPSTASASNEKVVESKKEVHPLYTHQYPNLQTHSWRNATMRMSPEPQPLHHSQPQKTNPQPKDSDTNCSLPTSQSSFVPVQNGYDSAVTQNGSSSSAQQNQNSSVAWQDQVEELTLQNQHLQEFIHQLQAEKQQLLQQRKQSIPHPVDLEHSHNHKNDNDVFSSPDPIDTTKTKSLELDFKRIMERSLAVFDEPQQQQQLQEEEKPPETTPSAPPSGITFSSAMTDIDGDTDEENDDNANTNHNNHEKSDHLDNVDNLDDLLNDIDQVDNDDEHAPHESTQTLHEKMVEFSELLTAFHQETSVSSGGTVMAKTDVAWFVQQLQWMFDNVREGLDARWEEARGVTSEGFQEMLDLVKQKGENEQQERVNGAGNGLQNGHSTHVNAHHASMDGSETTHALQQEVQRLRTELQYCRSKLHSQGGHTNSFNMCNNENNNHNNHNDNNNHTTEAQMVEMQGHIQQLAQALHASEMDRAQLLERTAKEKKQQEQTLQRLKEAFKSHLCKLQS